MLQGKRDLYKNKLALVVGGSEGIGKSLAKELLLAGAKVIICSRSQQKLQSAVTELARVIQDAPVFTTSVDVTDFEKTKAALEDLVHAHGVPDFLFQCAGFAHPGYIQDLDIREYRRMMDVNLFGVVNVSKILAPKMAKRGSGYIVNCSSIAGFIGLFGYTGYCASKFAVIGFSEALRRELAPSGVQVSVLCPPNTKTPGLEAENKLKPKEVLATEEKVTVVEPEFVAQYLLRNLSKNKFIVVPTFDGQMAHLLSRFAPKILNQFVKR